MNYYLLFLSVYSLCILPLTLQVELKLGKRFAYRLRARVTGMGFFRYRASRNQEKEKENAHPAFAGEAKEHDITEVLSLFNPALLRCLLSKELWRAAKRSVTCPSLWLRVRVAFDDAAATALTYGMLTAFMDALQRMDLPMPKLHVEAKASFSGEVGEALIGGILFVRLGSLALVATRFLAEYLMARGRSGGEEQRVEKENEHATAASHR